MKTSFWRLLSYSKLLIHLLSHFLQFFLRRSKIDIWWRWLIMNYLSIRWQSLFWAILSHLALKLNKVVIVYTHWSFVTGKSCNHIVCLRFLTLIIFFKNKQCFRILHNLQISTFSFLEILSTYLTMQRLRTLWTRGFEGASLWRCIFFIDFLWRIILILSIKIWLLIRLIILSL